MVVLDTSALLIWTLERHRLTATAERNLSAARHILISSISIWEIALKTARQRLTLPFSIDEYVARLKQLERVELLAVDDVTWRANVALPWDHRDPADRTIVATAKQRDCALLSTDRVIASFYPKTVW